VARRTTWLIDMGDGTWAVSCMACRIALYRGPKAGAELARHRSADRALRAAHRRRCPACGTRSARRPPGTTSLAADLALVRGRPDPLSGRRWPPARQVAFRSRGAGRR